MGQTMGQRRAGKAEKGRILDELCVTACLSHDVPADLTEIRLLGRTLKQRANDVLAYFQRPGTSNGPTEALNGRLEHLRGSALGFRNLTNGRGPLRREGHQEVRPGRAQPPAAVERQIQALRASGHESTKTATRAH